MARMIPSVIEREDLAPGEIRIFDALRDQCPDEWTSLHSLDLPKHKRQISGEMDFCVLIPGLAVIGLEVKSHLRVRRSADGLWHLGNDAPSSRGPFKQAEEATHSMRNRLVERNGSLAQVPFVSLVGFTHCRFEVEATEWEPWQVFDESRLLSQGLKAVLERVAKSYRAKLAAVPSAKWFIESQGLPTIEQCEQIVHELRPSFEQSRSPKARQAEATAEIRTFTAEQFEALDAVDESKRVVFNGAAGTGKTVIALEAARRAVASDKRTLLCCFNRLLGEWLTNEAAPLGDAATTGTLHSIMLRIAELDVPEDASSNFWAAELPDAAVEQLVAGHPLCGAFDLAVLDEAQDLFTDPYLDVIDLLLKNGLKGGELLAFGDFSHQTIYTGQDTRDLLKARTDWTTHRFAKNCRNRPAIGHLASSAVGDGLYASYLRSDDGNIALVRTYSSAATQAAELAGIIDHFRNEQYSLGDIVVLSPKADGAAAHLSTPHSGWIGPATSRPTNRIRTGTVHSFKGLESPVVILTDLENLHREQDRQLLYVGASRATERVALLVSDSDRAALAQIVTGENR